MRLRLELKNPAHFPGSQTERTLDAGSMVIGRSPQADWSLPDPERIISKVHCRIERTTQGFVIIDTSVNGLMLDNVPVSRGIPRPLGSVSTLQIGKALIEARMETTPAQSVPPAAAQSIPSSFVPGSPPSVRPERQTPEPPTATMPANIPDGPFGKASDNAPAGALSTNLEKPASAGPAALQDWWNPSAKPSDTREPGDDDIQSNKPEANIPSAARSGGFGDLIRSRGNLDAPTLAGLVEVAAEILPDEERRRLFRRLHELLGEASG